MRLFYHPESDSLFLDEFDRDGLCDDVTDQPKMRVAAKLRGLDISKLDIGSHFQGNPTMASAVIESYRRWDRKPADLYPTPVNGTESVIPVIEVMSEHAGCLGNGSCRIWEPACGDGRMSRVLEWHGFDVFSSDLRETPGYGHGGVDFLVDHEKEYGWDPKADIDMIVSNPPFKHAEAFIRKALSITPAVAMLLKQTYWNAASRLPFFAEHRPKLVLPLTFRLAFLESERGKSPLMDCCWVIWHEGDEDYCAFEPLPKRVYPGYHGPGLLSAMAALEEAMAGLTETVHEVVDQGGSASLLAGGGGRGATTA